MGFPKGVLSSPCPIKPGEHRGVVTEFKKGSVPNNKMPVGSVTIRIHKGDKPRAWIKVAEPNVWIPRAVHVWMQHGGTIPKGFVVHHDNGDTTDDSITNLKLTTRGAHRLMHHADIEVARLSSMRILPEKVLPCSKCGSLHKRKYASNPQLCPECRKDAARENKRRYKQRIRAAYRQ